MKIEYYYNVANMLNLQLKEEEAHYQQARALNNRFGELDEIEQRIKSLQNSLFSLNKRIGDLSVKPDVYAK